MIIMSGERFTNARVHEWLTPDIDTVVAGMYTTRVQLNSAALWWFCRRLTPEQRAEILGEYVKVQAMGGTPLPLTPPSALAEKAPPEPENNREARPRRRKAADRS
jgi:hypothetical protein